MEDNGYEDGDDNFDKYQREARQSLIDDTRKNLEENLEKAKLNKYDVFIVSNGVIFSVFNNKPPKKTTPAVDELRLIDAILRMAQERRYGTKALAWLGEPLESFDPRQGKCASGLIFILLVGA